MSDEKGKTESPTIGLSLELQYAAGRKVVFQTFVPQDINLIGINAILDKFNDAGDRAEAFYAQDNARRQLEVEEKAYANIQRHLGEVEANAQAVASADGKRNYKPSANDLKAKKQALDNVEESKRRIGECRKHLAELIVKAGNRDGASSPANS